MVVFLTTQREAQGMYGLRLCNAFYHKTMASNVEKCAVYDAIRAGFTMFQGAPVSEELPGP
jgi:hypothetical protein